MLFVVVIAFAGCQKPNNVDSSGPPTSLAEVPAVRLNYRYEADVPPPTEPAKAPDDERNAAISADFDQRRQDEILDRTLVSPDAKRIVAVYRRQTDLTSEFRLDMYSAEGNLLRKMTADQMAVHFPDTIRWSPDSANVAFVAMLRGFQQEPLTAATPPELLSNTANSNAVDPEQNAAADSNANANVETPVGEPTPLAPAGILTFRTEQIYISNSEGEGVKPITQNDGLIYFYYTWAPDSSGLAALAATQREWQYLQFQAETRGEIYVPVGRPRMVEKNGRERRLDDALTAVHPVWSPDSSKIACGYDKQIRVYDAGVLNPTQAAIPLRNQLLISSQAFDRDQQQKLNAENGQTEAVAQTNESNTATTLPDERTLVSFNPIVSLAWTSDDLLYFQTAFVKRMKKEADSVMSFPRWHRLVFSPQPEQGK
ncbi:MAG: hypothetical protein ACRD6X_06135 [Pyrinomonadaceae bacterium]